MTINRMIIFVTAIISIAVLTQACSEKDDTIDEVVAEVSAEPEMAEETPNKKPDYYSVTSITAAMLSIGAKCDAPKRGRTGCKWQGVSYTIIEPKDWNRQMIVFQRSCMSGKFSAQYKVVSNKESWIASANNGGDPTAMLHVELAKQSGLVPAPKLVKLCSLK